MTFKTRDDRMRAQFAKRLAVNCVRNTCLETYHAGTTPHSESGDGSDVTVIDATGRKIPWSEVSRISDEEMKALMKTVVDRLYTVLSNFENEDFLSGLSKYDASIQRWDTPKIDHDFEACLTGDEDSSYPDTND